MSVNKETKQARHGHVTPRPDGIKARCGGPAICHICQAEQSELEAKQAPAVEANDRELDAHLIDRLSKLLAEIALILNGEPAPLTRPSYHNLPDKVRALQCEVELLRAKEAPAVEAGARDEPPQHLKTLDDAIRYVAEAADGIKAGCACGDEWPDVEDKRYYDAQVDCLTRLRSIRAALARASEKRLCDRIVCARLGKCADDDAARALKCKTRASEAAAGGKSHASDCAVHNEPAYPNGPCDCGVALREEAAQLNALANELSIEGLSELAAGEPVALSDDELALIREESARITDDWADRQPNEPTRKETDAKFVREILRLAAPQPASEQQISRIVYAWLRRAGVTVHEDRVEELIGYLSAASEQQAARGLSDEQQSALLKVLELADREERHRTNQAWLNLRESIDRARAILAAKGDGHE